MPIPRKKIIIDKADRLYQMPLDLFSFVSRSKRPSLIKRTKVLDLGTFNWPIRLDSAENYGGDSLLPATNSRLFELKEELAGWLYLQHGTRFDPEREIFLGGSVRNMMLSLALAFIDPGDIAFVPDLSLPLYRRVVSAAGGESVSYSVSGKNDWQPNFDRLKTRLGHAAGFLFINSPHNPTGVELTEKNFEELIWLAGRENILIINDAAYCSIPARKSASLLAAKAVKKIGVEINSFSYLLGLPSLPFGFVAGNRDTVSGLKQVSRLMSTAIPSYWVDLVITALRQFPNHELKQVRRAISDSSMAASELFDLLSLERTGFDTVPYAWVKINRRNRSTSAAATLFRGSRILCVPGSAFGNSGEGYLRFSLTAPAEDYRTAAQRIRKKPRLRQLVSEK